MSRPVLHIAIPSPLRQPFDYLLPASFGAVAPGCRVIVPFGRREVVGMVLGSSDESAVPLARLRPALRRLDDQPALPESLFQLCRWAADYYHHPIGEVLHQALPVLLRQGEPIASPPIPSWHLTAAGRHAEALLQRAPRQRATWQALMEAPAGIPEPLLSAFDIDRAALRELQRKGFVEALRHTPEPVAPPSEVLAESPLTLTTEQAAACSAIRAALGQFHSFLLYGVTGSGKTEVYLQAIEAVLTAGRQALVLVPEIGLTPQTVQRFRQRFQVEVLALHSGLTDLERLQAWRAAREGRAGIVIGTRSALFTPLARPGLLIVDEEHDLSFKQQDGFRYSARDLAVLRGRLEQMPVVLGSATPALETLHNAQAGRYTELRLSARANAQSPRLDVVDLRHQTLEEGLAPVAVNGIEHHLRQGGQVLVFLNRRGYAPVLLCHDCGWQACCRRCDARLTLHRDDGRLHCHHCGFEARPLARCPDCGSSDLRPVGLGTERVEELLNRRWPETPVIRVDRDSTRRKQALGDKLEQIGRGEPCLLVGTQMLAKGHHFPAVTLVIILDVDGGLLGADYRAPERTAQLILQVAGRAGRAERPGHVLLQTRQPDHPLLTRLLTSGYDAFARSALQERQLTGLPPYGHTALLRAEAPSAEAPLALLTEVAEHCTALAPDLELWGPVPAPMERRAGRHRAQLLLKSDRRPLLHEALKQLLPVIEGLPAARRVRWSLDVDPQELG